MKKINCCERPHDLGKWREGERPVVYITTIGPDKFRIRRLLEGRHCHHGFGTFFWNIDPKQIKFSAKAWELLKTCVGRQYSSYGDLFGLSIHWVGTEAIGRDLDPHGICEWQRGFLMNYGFRGKNLTVPAVDAQIDLKCYELLKQVREWKVPA